MNPLAYFQWYRRMRGGYWAQVTSPLGLFTNRRWIRADKAPTPDSQWTYYPWAQKVFGNGYIDEWYSKDPWYATPLSQFIGEEVMPVIRPILDNVPHNHDVAMEPGKIVCSDCPRCKWDHLKTKLKS